MKSVKYIFLLIISISSVISCRDESLYPLPYNDRDTGAYLRMYSIASNVLDLNDLANSGFETTFEVVDPENGNQTESVDFFVSFRNGNSVTAEVFVKNVPLSSFASVGEPTISTYKRGTIRIPFSELQTALSTAPAQTGGKWPSLLDKISYPGSFAAGNQAVLRWSQGMKDGRKYSVANPQGSNPLEANTTANITGGQFYSSPYTFTVTARNLLGVNPFTQAYQMEQIAIWSPNHSVDQHRIAFPANLNQILFPAQTVNLSKVNGGLSTQREFQVTNYRGATVTLRLNFEQADPLAGNSAANISASLTGLLGATNTRPRGTVWVALQNSGVSCNSERGIYVTMPTTGLFGNSSTAANPTGSNSLPAGLPVMPAGTPQVIIPNRGLYFTDANGGTVVGERFFVAIDDDADEYGRRQGYCTWTRRVYLKFTKL
jgi:hypothetical protein